jgi:small subunit ribosomal protein S16
MLAIRFNRVGKKNQAQFRIVLQEHTVAPGGRHVEILGSYDPHHKKAVLKEERIKYWLSKGAQASDTVFNFFLSKGLVTGAKRKIKIPKKAEEVKPEEPKVEEIKIETKEEIKAEIPKEPARIATPARSDAASSGEQSVAGGEVKAEVVPEVKSE